MIGDAKITEIRTRASIVEVISDHLTLKKTGRNHIGLCPFHAEKTPSFTVNEEKGIFHCFGCGVGGNVFNFLMQFEHLSFPEAVDRVAKRYGIAVERADKRLMKEEADDRETLFRINERAAVHFREVLFRYSEGRKALEYLRGRGIEDAIARRFFLGYATLGGHGLVEQLKKEGLSLKDAARLGLAAEKRAGIFADKFVGRVMFPILDAAGRIVGFGGRVIAEGLPKYLNSPESPLFHKGSTLYGLYQAKEAIRREERVIVVEGYLDAIALCQFGISSVVATLGTALTPDHIRVLARYTKNIIALFDGDHAGRKAAARSFEIFIEGGVLGKGAFLPSGEDPDSFVRVRGKDALETVLSRPVPLADYYLSWLESQHGTSLQGRSQIGQEISRVLARIRNPFEADLLARRASDVLGIREELLRLPAQGIRTQGGSMGRRSRNNTATSPVAADRAERSLLGLVLRFSLIAQRAAAEQDLESLMAEKWKDVMVRALSSWKTEGAIDMASLMQQLTPEVAAQVSGVFLEAEQVEEAEAGKMMSDCLAHLRRRQLKNLQSEARRAIRVAEENQDENVRKERILEWQEIAKRKSQLERREL